MYVLIFILSTGNGYAEVKAMDYIFSSMKECKETASIVRENLMLTRPTFESNAQAYCTEIPMEV
tara:strand:+ start:950 stop:1141 length:192 start_codon:yes stop_codon:yes gene_type:complete